MNGKTIRRKLVPIGLALIVSMILTVAWLWSPVAVKPADFEKLKPGMSKAEVEQLLHGPPRNELTHDAIVWLPQANGSRISAWLKPGSKPLLPSLAREDLPKGGRQGLTITTADNFFPKFQDGIQAVWATKTGLIAVHFGPDGRLQSKYQSMVDELVPPSIGNWITTRFARR